MLLPRFHVKDGLKDRGAVIAQQPRKETLIYQRNLYYTALNMQENPVPTDTSSSKEEDRSAADCEAFRPFQEGKIGTGHI
jgi:hypothetical protein